MQELIKLYDSTLVNAFKKKGGQPVLGPALFGAFVDCILDPLPQASLFLTTTTQHDTAPTARVGALMSHHGCDIPTLGLGRTSTVHAC